MVFSLHWMIPDLSSKAVYKSDSRFVALTRNLSSKCHKAGDWFNIITMLQNIGPSLIRLFYSRFFSRALLSTTQC